jgi:class 3 adenylate cyclase/ligand-binding sensor domain-containing protein
VTLFTLDSTLERRTLTSFPGNYDYRPLVFWQSSIWAGAIENELWEISEDGRRTNVISMPVPKGEQAAYSRIVHLQRDEKDRLWILLDHNQLYVLEPGSQKPQKHPVSDLLPHLTGTTSLCVEADGAIWIAGDRQLWYYDPLSRKARNFHMPIQQRTKGINIYRQLYPDRSGSLWVASDFGLVKMARSDQPFETILSGGNDNCSNGFCSTRGISEDEKGNIYVCYYNSIHVIRPDGSFSPLFPKTSFFNSPFGLHYQGQALWTGNGRRIDLKTLDVTRVLPKQATDKGVVIPGPDGWLWFGFGNAIYRYNTSTQQLLDFSSSIPKWDSLLDISYLYFSRDKQTLWIGTTQSGLIQLSLKSKELSRFHTDAPEGFQISQNNINAIFEDESGDLWLATGNGLNRLRKTAASYAHSVYRMKDGLCNDYINGILPEGDSCLWVSTNNGLSRLSVASGRFSNFYREDGLSENEFNRISFFKSRKGKLYFGGINGLNSFFPGPQFVRKKKTSRGKVMLTHFSHFNDKADSLITSEFLPEDRPVQLSHNDKFFTFEFALAHFAQPRNNHYSYILEGFDDEWSTPSPYHTTRYHNIPAGNYRFRVRASVGRNEWIADELSIPISISQPYYKEPWFLISAFLVFLGLLVSIDQYRIFQAKKRERILEEEVKIRTRELEVAKKQSDDLLLNILPADTADELKKFGKAKAKRHEEVTVFFSDFQSFTKIAEKLEPETLVAEIDHCFRGFDRIMEKYQLEKIKTIGDAYMCVGGIPQNGDSRDPAIRVIRAALEIQEFLTQLALRHEQEGKPAFRARIGIHTGPVVSGIVGIKKFAYDIWGDTVNVAARLEHQCEIGKVNISESTYQLVQDAFDCQYRGKITAKNKGEIDMYYVQNS